MSDQFKKEYSVFVETRHGHIVFRADHVDEFRMEGPELLYIRTASCHQYIRIENKMFVTINEETAA